MWNEILDPLIQSFICCKYTINVNYVRKSEGIVSVLKHKIL